MKGWGINHKENSIGRLGSVGAGFIFVLGVCNLHGASTGGGGWVVARGRGKEEGGGMVG